MPPKTNSDKIDDLDRLAAALAIRLDVAEKELDRVRERMEATRAQLDAVNARLSGAERDLEVVKKSGDEFGRRAWAVVLALLSACIGGGITYLLKR